MEERIVERITALETRMAVAENNIETVKGTLSKIEGNTTWLLRIVIGAIVLAILGFFYSNPLVP